MYAIYGNIDPINIPPMLAYIPYMDPMGMELYGWFLPKQKNAPLSLLCSIHPNSSKFYGFVHKMSHKCPINVP